MKNDIFDIKFADGGISSVVINADEAQMNWIKPGRNFAVPSDERNARYFGGSNFKLVSFSESENNAVAEFRVGSDGWQTRKGEFTAKTEYAFDENGNFSVSTEFTNRTPYDIFFSEGDLCVNFNFFDDYFDANTCITSRCNTHIFCGDDSSYVLALRMGESNLNLGLVVTEGGLKSYSQDGVKSNDRGYFTVSPTLTHLAPNESYRISYTIFVCAGKEDFVGKLAAFPHCAFVRSENFTYSAGEKVVLDVLTDQPVSADGEENITTEKLGGFTRISFTAKTLGERKIRIRYGENATYAKIFVVEPLDEIAKKRIDYIVEKQQYREAGSTLDGAFLPYDSEEESFYYDERWSDLNGQRERLGMSLLIAYYLQSRGDERCRAALADSLRFVYREVTDENGDVFNCAKRFSPWLRLYNYPWVSLLFTECYKVFGDKKLLADAYKIMTRYYEKGGYDFYPNGIFVRDLIIAFDENGLAAEAANLKEKFLVHVEKIIGRGTNYPKHEVNYEQTIVTPAVSFILDAYLLTGDERYLKEIKPHVAALERFDGIAPHYMLNNIAIRYWDDFWFGKIHEFGDTLPHYWSSLSSICYIKYGRAAGDDARLNRGLCGLKNCLCLFMPDGSASCARLFPHKVNGVRGERFDPLCNDQDFALYFALKYLENR